jgi:SAM-dependent methyltransferase
MQQAQQANKLTVDDSEWWEQLYQAKKTPWDLGKPAPPLLTYLKSPYAVPPGKLAIPGCGNGHDCMPFLASGFEVTGIDFAPSAVRNTFQKFQQTGVAGTKGYLLERNIFDIHEYDGYYDYILEHCMFPALDPSRRRTYVYTLADLLKPGGKVIGLWWLMESKSGPPFPFTKHDIYELFDTRFNIEIAYAPNDSMPQRKNAELLTVMTKR